MGNTPAAQLARVKVHNPAWSIRKIEHGGDPPTYLAVHAGRDERVHAKSIGELANELSRRNGNGT